MPSYVRGLECPRCGEWRDAGAVANLCECGSPLLARYDLDAVRRAVTPADIAGRPADLWRYRELLPVAGPAPGGHAWAKAGRRCCRRRATAPRSARPGCWSRTRGCMPTGSFKARGAAVGVSRAAELGVRAHRDADQRQRRRGLGHLRRPGRHAGARSRCRSARPTITRRECVAAGAELHLVDGLIGDAGRLIATLVAESGGTIFDASTLKEPYRIEGKKTMGLEIVEQLGWRVPDVIVYPTGGGVGLIGIYKALLELRELGWLPDAAAAPAGGGAVDRLRADRAGLRGRATAGRAVGGARTIAFGITVPAPLGDELILDALDATERHRDRGGRRGDPGRSARVRRDWRGCCCAPRVPPA